MNGMVFAIILTLFFASEGLGLTIRPLLIFVGYTLALFLFAKDFWLSRKLRLPKFTVVLFGFLFIFQLVSWFFSLNRSNWLEIIFFLPLLILIFILSHNHKEEIKNVVPPVIFCLATIFCIFTVLLLFPGNIILKPMTAYQLIYSSFGSHNHLGDFLVFPVLLSLYNLAVNRKKFFIVPLLIFVPFLIFSYSRSAYISLLIPVLLMLFIKKFSKMVLPAGVLVIVFSAFFLATVREAKYFPVLGRTNIFLQENFGLKDKYARGKRVEFLAQSVNSFRDRPFFGVGPGNFILASREYSSIPFFWSSSSHNIFLDMLVENGIFAFASFLTLMIFILVYSKKDIFFFLFISLLINFQFDYTHKFIAFMVLLFILMGVTLQGNEKQFKTS